MRIFIHRGTRTFGPYSLEYARRELAKGGFKPTDMATYDGGGDRFVPLSTVPGIGAVTPGGSFREQADGGARKQKWRVGCCGWIGLFLVAAFICGIFADYAESDLKVDGETATLTVKVQPVDRPGHLGATIAQRVYAVAKRHEELTTIIIELKFYPTLLADQYGHEARGPLPMGTITVNDLSEVRRYTIDGAYMGESEGAFAEQIKRMAYAEYLTM